MHSCTLKIFSWKNKLAWNFLDDRIYYTTEVYILSRIYLYADFELVKKT